MITYSHTQTTHDKEAIENDILEKVSVELEEGVNQTYNSLLGTLNNT